MPWCRVFRLVPEEVFIVGDLQALHAIQYICWVSPSLPTQDLDTSFRNVFFFVAGVQASS